MQHWSEIGENQFDEILRLARMYYREAHFTRNEALPIVEP